MARLILSLGLTFALLGGVASAGPMRADAVGACAVATTLPEPPKNRPHYAMEIRVAPGMTSVHGTSTISFAPSVATDPLVFRLWPNSPSLRGAEPA